MRSIILSGLLLTLSLALNLTLSKYGANVYDWIIISAWLLPLAPLLWLGVTNEKTLRHRQWLGQRFSARPIRTSILATSIVIIVLISVASVAHRTWQMLTRVNTSPKVAISPPVQGSTQPPKLSKSPSLPARRSRETANVPCEFPTKYTQAPLQSSLDEAPYGVLVTIANPKGLALEDTFRIFTTAPVDTVYTQTEDPNRNFGALGKVMSDGQVVDVSSQNIPAGIGLVVKLFSAHEIKIKCVENLRFKQNFGTHLGPALPPRFQQANIRLSGEGQVTSTRDVYPYAYQATIQTDKTINHVAFIVMCDKRPDEVATYTMSGGVFLNKKGAWLKNNPRGYVFEWDSPPMTPATPIVVTVFGKSGLIKIDFVEQIDHFQW